MNTMTDGVALLEKRFRKNMDRISGLVRLLSSNNALKPTSVLGPSAGPRPTSCDLSLSFFTLLLRWPSQLYSKAVRQSKLLLPTRLRQGTQEDRYRPNVFSVTLSSLDANG